MGLGVGHIDVLADGHAVGSADIWSERAGGSGCGGKGKDDLVDTGGYGVGIQAGIVESKGFAAGGGGVFFGDSVGNIPAGTGPVEGGGGESPIVGVGDLLGAECG
ncbi:MAG: hypothetical protein UW51_C0013G0010 [Candidatus Amesbacteria bacterium GW2011_GWA1_44_24]|nr:MAG: hypothetical protein UW51_C0013G0010 [Candidatus Amesbacteria bacterium GW2011_GWA1_44_24]